MLAQVFAALALSIAPVQDAAAEATPEAVLDQLIARTNALKSFRASYHFKKGDEVDVRFELVYQAPDRMRLEIQQGSEPQLQTARTWVIGSRLIVRSTRGGGGGEVFGELDFEHPPEPALGILVALESAFQREPTGLGPGPQAVLAWGVDSGSDKAEFDLRLVYQSEDRRALLSWLDSARRSKDELALDEDFVLWRDAKGRTEARIARKSGFVEHLHLLGSDGTEASLDLVSVELDPDLDAALFEIPAPAKGATDMFPDPIKAAFGGLPGLRRIAYGWADDALESGRRAWDEALQNDWRETMQLLQNASLDRVHEGMEKTVSERSNALAAALREALGKAAPGDTQVLADLRDQAARQRETLVGAIDQELARYQEVLAKPVLRDPGSEHVPELLSIERAIVARDFDARVRQPLLELYDAKVREVLGG
jgi:outer membrane lipoprotein-sorting protein